MVCSNFFNTPQWSYRSHNSQTWQTWHFCQIYIDKISSENVFRKSGIMILCNQCCNNPLYPANEDLKLCWFGLWVMKLHWCRKGIQCKYMMRSVHKGDGCTSWSIHGIATFWCTQIGIFIICAKQVLKQFIYLGLVQYIHFWRSRQNNETNKVSGLMVIEHPHFITSVDIIFFH